MNTWVVGHVPIGHYIQEPETDRATGKLRFTGKKTFFMKGRIMAGQADLSANSLGYEDFRWLTKEETAKAVGTRYWSWVKNMLADR
jgi:large subunit ribosomal protein L46